MRGDRYQSNYLHRFCSDCRRLNITFPTLIITPELMLYLLNPMGGRPGLPCIAVKSAAAVTVAANGGLSTSEFKRDGKILHLRSTYSSEISLPLKCCN